MSLKLGNQTVTLEQLTALLAWDAVTIDEVRTILGLSALPKELGKGTVSDHRANCDAIYLGDD